MVVTYSNFLIYLNDINIFYLTVFEFFFIFVITSIQFNN